MEKIKNPGLKAAMLRFLSASKPSPGEAYAVSSDDRLSDDDEAPILNIASMLGLAVPQATPEVLWVAACNAIIQTRARAAGEIFDAMPDLPVRKAKKASDGSARFYWRVACENGIVFPATAGGAEGKTKGTIHIARRRARELFIDGAKPVELIPPDFDPKTEDPWTENTSKQQPAGMTVRQREKRH